MSEFIALANRTPSCGGPRGLIWMPTFGGMHGASPASCPVSRSLRCTARFSLDRLGLGAGSDSAWRSTGASGAATRLCLPIVVDSRSLRSAPTCWMRGIDRGKLIKGIKLSAVCDKHGSLLDLELAPANTDDRAGAAPMLPRLAELGFQGDLLGDSGYKGMPFAQAALDHDIHVSVSPGGTRDGQFLPVGIRWVVERLFAWLSRYRRLNTVFDRKPDLFAAHVL